MVDFLQKHIQNQKNILAINAAIPHMFGLNEIKENYPKHYKDVGIAEQESIALFCLILGLGQRFFQIRLGHKYQPNQ